MTGPDSPPTAEGPTADGPNADDPFDPAAFRALGHRIVDVLADHLAAVGDRSAKVVDLQPPDAMLAAVPPLDGAGGRDPVALIEALCRHSNRLHHPRYVGHQVCPPPPLLAMVEACNALLNNGMAIYEMGPIQSAMEARAVRWMCDRLGYPAGADGLLTSGGSLGNLTALLGARQRHAERHGPPARPCLLASAQSHYCVARAAAILGFGAARDAVVTVPVDDEFRMRPAAVAGLVAAARDAGRTPIALVANACTTNTGSFDPLDALADVCADLDLWLHVDGAHGAAFALAPSVRARLRGIARADSVVWDAHKMLQVPALVTGVLFRDGRNATAAFAQEAPYLFADGAQAPWYDRGRRTVECTKRGMGVQLYVALAVLGEAAMVANLEHCADLGRALAARVRAAADLELCVEPDCNIVCFRHAPPGAGDLDAHNRAVRARLLADGAFYVVQTTVGGAVWLRTTLINPRTTAADLDALLDAVRAAAGGAP